MQARGNKRVGINGTSHARTRGKRRSHMRGRPPKISTDSQRNLILRALKCFWPLGKIAQCLNVHPHTLSRFIRADEELLQQYADSIQTRVCEKIVDSEYKGTYRDHPLRAIFLYEKLHWLDLPHSPRRSHYRDNLREFPEILKPFGGGAVTERDF